MAARRKSSEKARDELVEAAIEYVNKCKREELFRDVHGLLFWFEARAKIEEAVDEYLRLIVIESNR